MDENTEATERLENLRKATQPLSDGAKSKSHQAYP